MNNRTNDAIAIMRWQFYLIAFFAYWDSKEYFRGILIHLHHLSWWKKINHPAWHVWRRYVILFNEEIGEMGLSVLSKKLKGSHCKGDSNKLRNDFISVHMMQDLQRQYDDGFHPNSGLFS